jgi:FemAB-related protein (PEP-CTERM system-associated)
MRVTKQTSIASRSSQEPGIGGPPPRLPKWRIFHYENPPGSEWGAALHHSHTTHLAIAPQWYSAIQLAYGHRPLYLQAEDSAAGSAVLPGFLVRRPLLGTVATSMPFLDAGGPCGGSDETRQALVNQLVVDAERLGANQVELRCLGPLHGPIEASLEKVTLVLLLPSDPDRLWRAFDPKVRNQIRKAERGGLTMEVGGVELLDDFYRVFAVNMRDLGSPVHSKKFFRAILDSFGTSARVVLARKDRLPLGGLISMVFQDTMYVPWASSLREHASLCSNMLLYWDTLRHACTRGLSRFDFGRSSRGSGSYRFKRQWGAEEAQLFWYTIPLQARPVRNVSGEETRWALMSRLWRHLPVSISRVIGPRIRGYLTQ